jgi:hypothetical protein
MSANVLVVRYTAPDRRFKMRALHLAVAVCIISTALYSADNPFVGTWKLNKVKSKYSPGPAPKELTVKFDMEGEKVRRKAFGIDGEGKPIAQGGKDGDALCGTGKIIRLHLRQARR